MLHQIAGIFDMVEIFADPVEGLQVAQPAFAFLDVGFDQIAAFALTHMARVTFRQLGFDEILSAAGGDFAPEFLAQIVEQPAITAEIAGFQQGSADGDVLLGEADAFTQRTGGVADLQTKIPQHIQNEFDDAFRPGRFLQRPHEQKIDVRSGS